MVYGGLWVEKILISASFILFLLWISGSHNRTTDWFWRTFYCSFYDWILYRSLFADDDFISLKSLNPSVWLIVMAAYSLRVSVGMDAGVGISGEFVDILNWRWIYWLSAIFTLVILFLPGGECHSHLLINHCSLKVIGEEWRLNA